MYPKGNIHKGSGRRMDEGEGRTHTRRPLTMTRRERISYFQGGRSERDYENREMGCKN